jgi:hypothetical protein
VSTRLILALAAMLTSCITEVIYCPELEIRFMDGDSLVTADTVAFIADSALVHQDCWAYWEANGRLP